MYFRSRYIIKTSYNVTDSENFSFSNCRICCFSTFKNLSKTFQKLGVSLVDFINGSAFSFDEFFALETTKNVFFISFLVGIFADGRTLYFWMKRYSQELKNEQNNEKNNSFVETYNFVGKPKGLKIIVEFCLIYTLLLQTSYGLGYIVGEFL